jgi:hypothetical protein
MTESMNVPDPAPREHKVEITVNTKPVIVDGPRQTGRGIKGAAIAQGVQIRPDFVLSEVIGQNQTRVIGDDDPVTVHPGSQFVAVSPDDNS